jgi:hypothetical protein
MEIKDKEVYVNGRKLPRELAGPAGKTCLRKCKHGTGKSTGSTLLQSGAVERDGGCG